MKLESQTNNKEPKIKDLINHTVVLLELSISYSLRKNSPASLP